MTSVSESEEPVKKEKTREEYRRNVKKLKVKLQAVEDQISKYQKKVSAYTNASNDKIIAMKLGKFCRERKITPEMLFRFADRNGKGEVSKADFKHLLVDLGLTIELSQHQITRLQYLLDEDISGNISKIEYFNYLHAFGLKAEYNADDPFLKDTLKKFDIEKIQQIAKDRQKEQTDVERKQHRNLLNYEQFLKYCHRHLPQLSDKEIASIFNRLEKKGLIDLDEFIAYLKKREEQDRKMRQKNKKLQKDKGKDKTKSVVQDEDKKNNTLKGIINALLKNRPKDSKYLFHSSQFQRLEKILQKNRGELLTLFGQIDKKRVGSFGLNQIIQFYIQREYKGDLLYTYELMGKKIVMGKEKPEDIIERYNKKSKQIKQEQFIKFMKTEFEVIQQDVIKVFQAVSKKQKEVPVRVIIEAMKLEEGQKKIVYIKPTLWNTGSKDFFKKKCITILFNPLVALRFCISIVEEMDKSKSKFWDDFQFGPTFQDPSGMYSINMDLPVEQVKWITSSALGMDDFYVPANHDKQYISSTLCLNEMFQIALSQLAGQSEDFLWCKKKIEQNTQKLEEEHLNPLFEGLYPRVFHSFAKYGVFVFKFFVKQKWAYVIVDSKIPCGSDGQPLFSMSVNRTCSWISLIEKAYAKIKGNYQQIYSGSPAQYLFELSRFIPVQHIFPRNFKTEQQKDYIWGIIAQNSQKLYAMTTNENSAKLIQNNVQTGLRKNKQYRIENYVQIKDQKSNNSHKSHRLILMKADQAKNVSKWNPNWCQGEGENKFTQFDTKIDRILKEKGSYINVLKEDNRVKVINFKLFRGIFDRIVKMKKADFAEMIILRKIVEFEEKHRCRYEIQSEVQTPLTITLNSLKSPSNTTIKIHFSDKENNTLFQYKIDEKFGCTSLKLSRQLGNLEIWVENWHKDQDHAYILTFYFDNPRYHLRELDRHLLFRYVSPYEEAKRLRISDCQQKQQSYIYRHFYRAAERTRGCCG